jgi:hypothetical protein
MELGPTEIWMGLLTICNSSEYYQSSGDPLRYEWIHLPTAIVQDNSISHQSNGDLLRYGWVHLPPAIVKNNRISHQGSGDPPRYGWVHLQTAIAKITVSTINLVETS